MIPSGRTSSYACKGKHARPFFVRIITNTNTVREKWTILVLKLTAHAAAITSLFVGV